VDPLRCALMATVHDLAEALVGDIAPADGVPASVKMEREEAAMHTLAALLDQAVLSELSPAGGRNGASSCSCSCSSSSRAALEQSSRRISPPSAMSRLVFDLWKVYASILGGGASNVSCLLAMRAHTYTPTHRSHIHT
jgi:HD domain